MPFQLPVTISGFKFGFHRSLNGSRTETFSTDAIIRASLIAGHPEDGPALDPLITAWREASVRLALQLPASGRVRNMQGLVHPKAWKNLEPSEKAGVNNILGNTVTKLLSEKLLRAPRMWFLDLYKEEYKAVVKRPQRPDFFARTRDKQWVALEAKGRVNTPTTKSLRRAKSQARALTKVNGKAVVAHIVCWTMAKDKGLEARFHDPVTRSTSELSITVDYNKLLRDYYRPIQEIIAVSRPAESIGNTQVFWFDAGDFGVGLHPMIAQALQTARPEQLINRFDSRRGFSNAAEDLHAGLDGIIVIPGRSWPKALEQPRPAVGS